MPSMDRKSYDIGVADSTEESVSGIINRLETLINERDRQAKTFLADFKMTNTDEDYHRVETRWKNASDEVREIISILRKTIGTNSGTARTMMQRANGHVQNIG